MILNQTCFIFYQWFNNIRYNTIWYTIKNNLILHPSPLHYTSPSKTVVCIGIKRSTSHAFVEVRTFSNWTMVIREQLSSSHNTQTMITYYLNNNKTSTKRILNFITIIITITIANFTLNLFTYFKRTTNIENNTKLL